MLQNIQDYVEMAPNGIELLKDTCKRRFPLDDTWVHHDDSRAFATETSVADIIQEILQRHASGIHFREYNAGPNLDSQMSDKGFNIDIEVDWKTGIIYGGNEHNCGTWQDKMGESEKAGSKGLPGTSRDGAPVEITGLTKSALRWVAKLSAEGKFPHKGVKATGESSLPSLLHLRFKIDSLAIICSRRQGTPRHLQGVGQSHPKVFRAPLLRPEW
jgi:glycogen debranching enzyme